MKDVYTGEAQFMAWGDGPSGPWIKLRLPDSEGLEHFRGMTKAKEGMAGQILAIKIVEVEYVEPPAQPAHRKQGPLEMLAIRWGRTESFREWMETGVQEPVDENYVRDYILKSCGVGHRRDLDTSPAAAQKFHKIFREPYMEYLEKRG